VFALWRRGFVKSCAANRRAIYGLLASSPVKPRGANLSNGSAFMVAPGFLIAAAHGVYFDNDPTKPQHQKFEVIRAPDIGQQMETATLVAVDNVKDLALLRIASPRSTPRLKMLKGRVPAGTPCGSLGFPLAQVGVTPQGVVGFNLWERFQGASISRFGTETDNKGNTISFYETDSLMYEGSSGCPGFIASGEVFGMQSRSMMQTAKAGAPAGTRLAISMWVSSMDIIAFVAANGVVI